MAFLGTVELSVVYTIYNNYGNKIHHVEIVPSFTF